MRNESKRSAIKRGSNRNGDRITRTCASEPHVRKRATSTNRAHSRTETAVGDSRGAYAASDASVAADPTLDRRSFLKTAGFACAGAAVVAAPRIAGLAGAKPSQPAVTRAYADEPFDESSAGALVNRFFVMSDTHLDLGGGSYEERLIDAFEDIAQMNEAPEFIIVNGDITNDGTAAEYDLFRSLATDAGLDFANRFTLVMGNHEQSTSDTPGGAAVYAERRATFKEHAGTDEVYFERSIAGAHLIALGPDLDPTSDWVNFKLSGEQLAWLDAQLSADEVSGRLSLVFCHEPLHGTVKDTTPGTWGFTNSIENDAALADVIGRHGNLVFFSGHTHAYPDCAVSDDGTRAFVASGSVAYEYQKGSDDSEGSDTSASSGLLVSLYEHALAIDVRDFDNERWDDRWTFALPL